MEFEGIVGLIESLGLPVAILIAVGLYFKGFMTRMLDESKERELANRTFLAEQTKELSIVGETLTAVQNRLDEARKEHVVILEYHKEENEKSIG